MPRMKNNADMFAKRGNPWHATEKPKHPVIPMTDEERELSAFRKSIKMPALYYASEIRELARTESDPDMDRWTKASFKTEKIEIKKRLVKKQETAKDKVLHFRKAMILKHALRNQK